MRKLTLMLIVGLIFGLMACAASQKGMNYGQNP